MVFQNVGGLFKKKIPTVVEPGESNLQFDKNASDVLAPDSGSDSIPNIRENEFVSSEQSTDPGNSLKNKQVHYEVNEQHVETKEEAENGMSHEFEYYFSFDYQLFEMNYISKLRVLFCATYL